MFPKIKFKPHYLFVGFHLKVMADFFDTENIKRIDRSPYIEYPKTLYIDVCILPMFPVCIQIPLFKRKATEDE